MKADTSPSPVEFADTMPYAYSIVKTQKAGACALFGNVHTSRDITYPVARSCSSDHEGVFLCANNHRSRVTRGCD
jgi:hypothetical protein